TLPNYVILRQFVPAKFHDQLTVVREKDLGLGGGKGCYHSLFTRLQLKSDDTGRKDMIHTFNRISEKMCAFIVNEYYIHAFNSCGIRGTSPTDSISASCQYLFTSRKQLPRNHT